MLTEPYSMGVSEIEKQTKKTATKNERNIAQEQSYKIGKIRFVVQPIFKEKDSDTLGAILWRLMRSEMEK